MTPTQRDELAEMAGGKRKAGLKHGYKSYYEFPSTFYVCDDWHPETSFDDCRPLLEEIERRGLREEFMRNLAQQCSRILTCPIQAAWWALCHAKPADIVAAFQKTIEEAGRKEQEQ